jgi:protocatechuate 3,4-dioxygenase beta subunit
VRVRALRGAERVAFRGVTVRLESTDGRRRTADTDPDGVVRFEQVPPGAGLVCRLTPDEGAAETLAGLVVHAGLETDLGDVVFDAEGTLRGLVVDPRGRPVAAVVVTAAAAEPDEEARGRYGATTGVRPDTAPAARGESDAEGRYELRGLAAGPYRLRGVGAGLATREPSPLVRPRRAREAPPLVVEAVARIAGVVHDARGEPVAGAEVTADAAEPGFARGAPLLAARGTAVTDARGQFALDGVAPGHLVRLAARKDGVGSVVDSTARLLVREELVVLRLAPTGRVVGRVVDEETGRGIAGASVVVMTGAFDAHPAPPGLPDTAPPRGGASVGRALSDADGRFAVTDLGAGPVGFARVEAEAYAPVVVGHAAGSEPWGVVPVGGALEKEVRLSRGVAVEGRVVRAGDGAPVPGALVRVVYGDSLWSGVATAAADAGGAFLFEGVRTGVAFVVSASAPGLVASAEDLAVRTSPPRKAGETVAATVRLVAGGVVVGAVRDEAGAPVPGAVVRLRRPDLAGAPVRVDPASQESLLEPTLRPGAETGLDGRFRFDGLLPQAAYVLEAAARGHVAPGVPVVGPAPGALTTADVVLRPAVLLEGSVVSAADRGPVPGAIVELLVPPEGKADAASWRRARSVVTGADGRFAIDDAPAGTVSLRAWADGFALGGLCGVRVDAGGGAPGPALALAKADPVAGRVRTARGAPVRRALVLARVRPIEPGEVAALASGDTVLDPCGDAASFTSRATTDDEGTFRLATVPAGARVFVCVASAPRATSWARGSAAASRTDVPAGTPDLEFALDERADGR